MGRDHEEEDKYDTAHVRSARGRAVASGDRGARRPPRRLAGRQDGDVHAPQYGEARLEERVTKQAEPREGRADSGAGA